MFSLDGSSASASSPYSNMSTTDSSSPEASGDQKPNIMRYEQGKGDENRMSGMNLNGYQNNFHNPQVKPESQRTSPIRSVNPQSLTTLSLLQQADSRRPLSTVSSSHAGTRSEHPKRQIELSSDIPVINPSLNELGQTSSMNRLLLQGDPQFIDKQRVETAIRVILDLLRLVPATKSTPTLSPQLQTMMHRDGNGNLTTSVAKIGTFQAIRLQAGATTKLPSKKQQQAQPIPLEKVLFLETAVHRIGDNGKRVYACKKCRAREAKRRQSKESGLRKKGYEATSGSDSSNQKKAQIKMEPSTEADRQPSRDYITGVNSDQYDAGRTDQMVEEPSWNPHKADWRNEIVLFNTAPEIPIVDGSCNWLPFRVVCYGKCHNEKHGFRITFNLRTHTGEIIATAVTNPIRITDDHKTDSKVKPKADGMSQSSVRGRKGRASVASSRQLSPAPSEGESVQSLSEAGAVLQRQTPSVRAGKPYERPPSQSPLVGTIPMDGQFQSNEPQFHRSMSAASIHSLGSFTSPNNPGDVMAQMQNRASEFPMFNGSGGSGTVSPGALRRPHFGFTPLHTPYDGTVSLPPSSSHSVSNSSVGSPMMMALNLGQDDMLFDGRSPTDLMNGINASSLYNLEQQQQHGSMSPPYRSYANDADIEMSNAVNSGFHGLFDTSSLASLDDTASSFTSYSGALADNASVYSQSGVVPESVAVPEEEEFMDYSACEGVSSTPLTAPTFGTSAQQDIMSANGYNAQISPKQTHQQTQVQDFMSLLSQPMAPVPPPQPAANAPMISTIIPAEGPMAGGTTVAIIGANFTPGLNIMFGDRSARVQRIDPTFIQCQSPPAAIPGSVEVTITGVARSPMGPCLFKYNMMDTDLMRLALQVKDQYAGTTDNAAYRLAQHIAAGTDRSSTSPLSSGPSQNYSMGLNNSAAVDNTDPADDLQLTVINFLASVDKDAPGALRRSGMVNHPTEARQTLLHIATVMGFHRLVRRLIVIGAQLDVQDVNGYTALGLASLMGQVACARVLIEGGASYDRPTLFGEMPLDLAKIGEHPQIEALLLSAVWSTDPTKKEPEPKDNGGFSELTKPILGDAPSEIDNDNPSDSEEEIERVFTAARPRRLSKKARGKRRVSPTASLKESTAGELATTIPLPPTRSISLASGSTNTATESSPLASPTSSPPDLPPPYESHTSTMTSTSSKATSTWSSGDRATVELPLPDSMWSRTITSLLPDKMTHNLENGWVTLPVPAPSWETLQKMTSPEEVKLFTQAMAAAAFNAVVQSGATTSSSLTDVKRKRRKSRNGREDSSSPSRKMVKQVKSDRMLYLFWLPILLFVGFWLLVTALPIATGFCLIYARQITRAIKQRI